MQLRNILFAVALLVMAPASAALAEECTFVPGDTVLQERGASDQRITQFLSDLGASRSGQTINMRIFSEQVALTMVQGNLAERVSAACRNQLAAGFTSVNGLQGTMTDAQFATKVRSTGFRLPTMVAVAQAPAPPPAAAAASPLPIAQPAPPPVQVARLSPADRATLESLTTERAQLRGQISELRGRPFITSNDRQLLDSLQGNLDAINTRIEVLTSLSTRLRTDVDGLRRDVTGLRTDVDAQGRNLGSLTWLWWLSGVPLLVGLAALALSLFKKPKVTMANVSGLLNVTSRLRSDVDEVKESILNVAEQVGVDKVDFSPVDYTALKQLPTGESAWVAVLVNGEEYTKLRFERVENGHYICISPPGERPGDYSEGTEVGNPLKLVRKAYRDGKLPERGKLALRVVNSSVPGFSAMADS